MALRDTNPKQLRTLIEETEREWANITAEDRVQQTSNTFIQAYILVAEVAWEVEASRGNLREPSKVSEIAPGELFEAKVRDSIASNALNRSAKLNDLMDKLEAQQQIIAAENFGDHNTPIGKSSERLVVLINGLRPIAEVVQDVSADNKSIAMDRLETIQRRDSHSSS